MKILAIALTALLSVSAVEALYYAGVPSPRGCHRFLAKVGVAPVRHSRCGHMRFLNTHTSRSGASSNDGAQFRHHSRGPIIFGLEYNYSVACNFLTFAELDFIFSRRHDDCFTVGRHTIRHDQHFRALAGYIGGRQFWDFWCNSAAFFVGAKVGILHRRPVCFRVECDETGARHHGSVFCSTNGVSGGVQAGLEYYFCGNGAFTFNAEVVGSSRPRTNHHSILGDQDGVNTATDACANCVAPNLANSLPLTPVNGTSDNTRRRTHIFIGNAGTSIHFPITFGLSWKF